MVGVRTVGACTYCWGTHVQLWHARTVGTRMVSTQTLFLISLSLCLSVSLCLSPSLSLSVSLSLCLPVCLSD